MKFFIAFMILFMGSIVGLCVREIHQINASIALSDAEFKAAEQDARAAECTIAKADQQRGWIFIDHPDFHTVEKVKLSKERLAALVALKCSANSNQ